jgi:DNA-binding IclR family transcriptional regulator
LVAPMKTVKSVQRAAQILDGLAAGGELTIGEIRLALKMPKSTAHEIITTLVSQGFVEKSADGGAYRLGLKMFELGIKAQGNLEIRTIATPLLKELNVRFDEAVHLTVLDAGEVLYVESLQSSKSLRTHSAVGLRAPLHCTGVGKAIMAFLSTPDIDAIIRRKKLPRFTARTITTRAGLFAELEKTLQRGFSIDDCEHEDGVRCVGAPVRDHTGRVVGSISIAAPAQRMPRDRVEELGRAIMTVANEVTRLMGCPAADSTAGRGEEVRRG